MTNEYASDLIIESSANPEGMAEIRVLTLAQYAFEHHYPSPSVEVQPSLFLDGNDRLSLALDEDILDEFTHEKVLLTLLNLREDVNLTNLDKSCQFGKPITMLWHSDTQMYVRGLPNVAEPQAVE